MILKEYILKIPQFLQQQNPNKKATFNKIDDYLQVAFLVEDN